MLQILKDFFLNLVREYGTFSSFCITALLCLLIYLINSVLKRKSGILQNDFIHKYLFYTNKKQYEQKLEQHVIFKKLEASLEVRLDHIRTSCSIRKVIFQKIFKIRTKLLLEALRGIIKKDINVYNIEVFHQEILFMLQKINNDWKNECLEEGIPDFVIQQVESEIKPYRKVYFKQIERIMENSYLYYNNKERMIAVFDILIPLQEMILNETQHILSSFNGELKGKTVCGASCQDCAKCVHEIYLKKKQEELKEQQQKTRT